MRCSSIGTLSWVPASRYVWPGKTTNSSQVKRAIPIERNRTRRIQSVRCGYLARRCFRQLLFRPDPIGVELKGSLACLASFRVLIHFAKSEPFPEISLREIGINAYRLIEIFNGNLGPSAHLRGDIVVTNSAAYVCKRKFRIQLY